MGTKPLVSVFMATYNHAPFIVEALESCLMQETDFSFEIVVCDDFSTDGTREIIKKYAEKYDNIVMLFQPKNSKSAKNFLDGMLLLRGKYVAFCEGDDFWLTKDKLQKQITFLEANPDFSVCCHKVEMRMQGKNDFEFNSYIYKDLSYDEERIQKGEFYADECLTNYYFQTSSVVFRWRFCEGFPVWFTLNMLLDHFLFMLHAVEGKIKYFDEPMSAWRRQPGGYSWLQTINKGLFFAKKLEDWILIYEEIDNFFSQRFTLQIRERILLGLRNVVSHYVQTNQLEKIVELYEEYPKYFNAPVLENAIMLDGLRLAMPQNREFYPPWAKCSKNTQNTEQESTIGGFFALDIASIPKSVDSIWQHWIGEEDYTSFANAEQALVAWLWHIGVRDIWLPNYYTQKIKSISPKIPLITKIYTVGDTLNPSIDFVQTIQAGHAICTVAFLGKPLSEELEQALLARPDIFWIEDRRHALDTGRPSKAHAVIYSPQDIVGVPDGALLVGKGLGNIQTLPVATASSTFFEKLSCSIKAMEEPMRTENIVEYSGLLQKEALPATACSQLTIDLLQRLPIQNMIEKRKQNWAYLVKHLKNYALWPEEHVDFAPYAFPIKIPDAHAHVHPIDILLTLLSNNNIFCIPSWQIENIPGLSLSVNCVLLPCDHRYGYTDMDRMVAIIQDYLVGNIDKNFAKSW